MHRLAFFLMALVCGSSAVTLSRPGTSHTRDSIAPVEVLHVSGCEGSSKPRRDAFGCLPGTRVTVRGRGFHDFGNEVLFEEVATPRAQLHPPRAGADSSPRENLARLAAHCQGTHSSAHLPTQLLYCTIPRLDVWQQSARGRDTSDADALEGIRGRRWFDVKVTSRTGQVAVLRRSMQIVFSTEEGSRVGGRAEAATLGQTENEDRLRAFRNSDFLALGIGGLEKPIKELFRRAFSTRMAEASGIAQAIGMPHVRGVILHGPPGTGKTLIARTVAELLDAKNVQIVNGPEIMSKFVGESEKNLRQLFGAAEDDFQRNGAAAGLHVLIFDEIDAVLRPRGEGDDSAARAVYDGVTTQMLAYMDGIHARTNLLIIGLTNRLDALDKALLRPGRFEVQIRIPLPDHEGRKQIFAVHTRPLKSNRYLDVRVDFDRLAAETTSFSGADIAGVVRSAISIALERHTEAAGTRSDEEAAVAGADPRSGDPHVEGTPKDGTTDSLPGMAPCGSASLAPSFPGQPAACSGTGGGDGSSVIQDETAPASSGSLVSTFRVTHSDLLRGIQDVLQSKRTASNLAPYLRHGFVRYGTAPVEVLKSILGVARTLASSPSTAVRRVVVGLYGESGMGTTTTSALAAKLSKYSYTQMLTGDSLTGLSTHEKLRNIASAFETAAHAPTAFLVLDKLEDILEYNLGRRPVDKVATELMGLVGRDPTTSGAAGAENAKLLVLITTSRRDLAERFGNVWYDLSLKLPSQLPSAGVAELLCSYAVTACAKDARKMVNVLPPTVSLKRLMFLIHMARTERGASPVDAAAATLQQATANDLPFGDLASGAFAGDFVQSPQLGDDTESGDSACSEEGCGEASEVSESRRKRFMDVVKTYGWYHPKNRVVEDATSLFL